MELNACLTLIFRGISYGLHGHTRSREDHCELDDSHSLHHTASEGSILPLGRWESNNYGIYLALSEGLFCMLILQSVVSCMGLTGVSLETMEGKAMAIDSSIWIYQFQATMRDKEGRALVNAHLLGFLRRICKLLYYGIKPVFVFDGGAPALKRTTLVGAYLGHPVALKTDKSFRTREERKRAAQLTPTYGLRSGYWQRNFGGRLSNMYHKLTSTSRLRYGS